MIVYVALTIIARNLEKRKVALEWMAKASLSSRNKFKNIDRGNSRSRDQEISISMMGTENW